MEYDNISDSMKKWISESFKDDWETINTDIDFNKHEPIDISSSLHVIQYTYNIDDNKYKVSYPIDDLETEPLVEILKK